MDSVVPTPACECFPIWTKRHPNDVLCVPCEQIAFLTGLYIIQPNADGTRYRKEGAVWGICYLNYRAFIETRFDPFGQIPRRMGERTRTTHKVEEYEQKGEQDN